MKNAKIVDAAGNTVKALAGKTIKVKVPTPSDFTYADGGTPKFGMTISKMEAEKGVKVATPNTVQQWCKTR